MSDPSSTSTLERFRNFRPAGPIAAGFMADNEHEMCGLLGPVGAGKSVSCIFKHLRHASEMPVCLDGVIRFRLAVIGLTYGQMEKNLFPTWLQWLPANGGGWTDAEFKGGGGRYAEHKINYDIIRDGRRIQVQFVAIFAAIGDNAVEQFMRGFEPTAFWLYEMDLLSEDVLNQALFRLGRYPAMHQLAPGTRFHAYIVGDYNAPDIDSWCYRRFEEDKPAGHRLYRQPSGRSPRAENLGNLPAGYYDRQVKLLAGQRGGKFLVRRYVDAEYGPSLDGEPVFPEYSDDVHLARARLEVIANLPLLCGFDQGLQRPAGIIFQQPSNGQFRILAECMPGRMGSHRFVDEIRRVVANVAPGRRIEQAWADPAGFYGADKEAGESAWAESVSAALEVPIEPAPTNELDPRLNAVRDELTHMIDGQTPALIINADLCPILRKGFTSHYRYKRQFVGGREAHGDKPEKNDWSNVHDGLQYGLLGVKGRYGAIVSPRASDREDRRKSAREARPSAIKQAFHPFARRR